MIAGPTAVGKTALALDLAERLHTSIISADSRQCYREMRIGTARPGPEELARVRHYFVDTFPVSRHISAADFENLALGYLDEIFKTSSHAVVCGGTGLYLKALTEGLDEMPAVDPEIEKDISKQYQALGLKWLQDSLADEDPGFFEHSEQENPARLLRALIFKRSTGKSILDYRTGKKKQRDFQTIKLALTLPRELLYQRINIRVDQMMEAGLLEEVRSLLPWRDSRNLQTVGYAELFAYLDGKCSLDEAVEKIRQHTRNYAKRQLTWFRKDPEYRWFSADDPDLINKILAQKA